MLWIGYVFPFGFSVPSFNNSQSWESRRGVVERSKSWAQKHRLADLDLRISLSPHPGLTLLCPVLHLLVEPIMSRPGSILLGMCLTLGIDGLPECIFVRPTGACASARCICLTCMTDGAPESRGTLLAPRCLLPTVL